MVKAKKKRILTKAEKQAAEREKRERLARIEAETRRRHMAAGELTHYDERTAHGARPYHIAPLGGKTRISVNQFARCFPKRADRTDARILAWAEFDDHYSRVMAGAIPPQGFEPGVDSSATPGTNVTESRLDAIRRDKELQGWLGAGHGLLVQIIHEGHSLDEIEVTGQYEGASEVLAIALDRAAVWFDVADKSIDPTVHQALNHTVDLTLEALSQGAGGWSGKAWNAAEARDMAEQGFNVRTIQKYFGVTYRLAYTTVGDIVAGQESKTLAKWRGKKEKARG